MSNLYAYACFPERQGTYLSAIIDSETFAANAVVKTFKKKRGEEIEGGGIFAMDRYEAFTHRSQSELEKCEKYLKETPDAKDADEVKAYIKELNKYLSYSYDDYVDSIIAKEKAYIKELKSVKTVDDLVAAAGGRILFQSYTEEKKDGVDVSKSTFFVVRDHKLYVNFPKLNGIASINTDEQVPYEGWITTEEELNKVREQYGSDHNDELDKVITTLFERYQDVIIKFL